MGHRGQLRVYLGAAPGVGKTFRMLDEGNRRFARGTDVVVAFVQTHGRTRTAERIGDLPLIPRKVISYRGADFEEMDLDAVLARRPEVALVDELAHTNLPGAGYAKRWQTVEVLLEAGIDVISTVNVQHLESLNDVVRAITGVPQRETVPDSVVRAAEQVELVDMTPEALRRRMAHGNIYQPDKVDAALSNYFRPGNLTALRELALLWLADSVEEGLQRYREQHGIAETWETKERVVVAVTGGPEGEALIRRAGRIADRAVGGELLAVHIARGDGLAGSSIAELDQQRLLVETLGGSYHSIIGDDIPTAVLEFARAKNATQIVIGASRRNPVFAALTGPGTGMTITRRSGSIDVHVVSHDYIGKGRVLPRLSGGLTARRRVQGLLTAGLLMAVLVPICAAYRADLTLASVMLLFLFVVVLASLIGGFFPALAGAVVASLLLNYYFIAPIHRFSISDPQNVFSLVVFVAIAALVSRVVDLAARRTSEAARSNAEAETLSTLAGSLLRGEHALPALIDRIRETFAVDSVALLRRESDAPGSGPGSPSKDGPGTRSKNGPGSPSKDGPGPRSEGSPGPRSKDGPGPQSNAAAGGLRGTWSLVAGVGENPCVDPDEGDTEVPVGDDLLLVLRGRRLAAEDQRMLVAFATEVAVAYHQRRLSEAAESASSLAESDRTRTALLNAVSHDLRTPIASAKAAVSSLLADEMSFSEHDRRELLASADSALNRLTALVTNLLDLSRLKADALALSCRPVGLDDVVSHALRMIAGSGQVAIDVPPELPEVIADPGLLERAIANVVENAMRFNPAGERVRVAASAYAETVELRVIDRGPGVSAQAQQAVFEPFQRRDDRAVSTGASVGLGLAIARGFVEAMRGSITLEDTPGGGLTVSIALPTAPGSSASVSASTAGLIGGA